MTCAAVLIPSAPVKVPPAGVPTLMSVVVGAAVEGRRLDSELLRRVVEEDVLDDARPVEASESVSDASPSYTKRTKFGKPTMSKFRLTAVSFTCRAVSEST